MLSSLYPGIWLVAPDAAPRYPYSNSLYIEDDIPAVIDFGAGSRALGELPVAEVQLGFISHFHFDHLHCTPLFPDINLLCGQEERATYSSEEEYMSFHGYNLWQTIMPGIKRQLYGQVVKLADDVPVNPGFRRLNMADIFTDGQQFKLGRHQLTAIHLPGHTAGHYGFYFPHYNLLFSGDIDLAPAGPWYSSNSANVESLKSSIRKIIALNPDTIVSSHRRVLKDNLRQQLEHYLQVVLDREDNIYSLLSTPQNLDSLAEHHLVFPGERNTYDLFWEKMTIRNHLISMCGQEVVKEVAPGYYQRS
ncbi:MAG: MBL fold metallo-hydrolase [Methylocystaceae bacterium]